MSCSPERAPELSGAPVLTILHAEHHEGVHITLRTALGSWPLRGGSKRAPSCRPGWLEGGLGWLDGVGWWAAPGHGYGATGVSWSGGQLVQGSGAGTVSWACPEGGVPGEGVGWEVLSVGRRQGEGPPHQQSSCLQPSLAGVFSRAPGVQLSPWSLHIQGSAEKCVSAWGSHSLSGLLCL